MKSGIQTTLFPVPSYRVAEIQLSYKSQVSPSERPKITCSRDAYEILYESWNKDTLELREEFKVIMLNRGNRAIGLYEVSVGGLSGTVADPKHILAAALLCNAAGIILAHNHPSTQLQPSNADIELTKKLKFAANSMDIVVPDHLIIGGVKKYNYLSFSDEGIMP